MSDSETSEDFESANESGDEVDNLKPHSHTHTQTQYSIELDESEISQKTSADLTQLPHMKIIQVAAPVADSVSSINDVELLSRSCGRQSSSKDETGVDDIWGWGGWSKSFMSTASVVSSITHQVGQGFTSALETLESGLNIPSPNALAKADHNDDRRLEKDDDFAPLDSKPLKCSLMSGLTNVFESTGSRVITSGLDALEIIGKKTMVVIQDPIKQPSLLQALSEARVKHASNSSSEMQEPDLLPITFATEFLKVSGSIHLEALKSLSKSNAKAVEDAKRNFLAHDKRTTTVVLSKISEICQLPEVDPDSDCDGDFDQVFCQRLYDYNNKIMVDMKPVLDKILQEHSGINLFIKSIEGSEFPIDLEEINRRSVVALAQLTSHAVEFSHKVCELLLAQRDNSIITEELIILQGEAITNVLSDVATAECQMSNSFCESLNSLLEGGSLDGSSTITNVYYECSQSCFYLRNCATLIVPILQNLYLSVLA